MWRTIGICPVCKKRQTVIQQGNLMGSHKGNSANYKASQCPGSYQPPLKIVAEYPVYS